MTLSIKPSTDQEALDRSRAVIQGLYLTQQLLVNDKDASSHDLVISAIKKGGNKASSKPFFLYASKKPMKYIVNYVEELGMEFIEAKKIYNDDVRIFKEQCPNIHFFSNDELNTFKAVPVFGDRVKIGEGAGTHEGRDAIVLSCQAEEVRVAIDVRGGIVGKFPLRLIVR